MTDITQMKTPIQLSRIPNELQPIIGSYYNVLKNMHTRQQAEITYLKKHHLSKMEIMEIYEPVLKENSKVSVASLQAREIILDDINCGIIQKNIHFDSTSLNLKGAGITRFPITLLTFFSTPVHIQYWQNLTELYLQDNQITELNLQWLLGLRILHCECNKLTAVNIKGLRAVVFLYCEDKQFKVLNEQGLTALTGLNFNNNALGDFNFRRIPDETEGYILFAQLSEGYSDEITQTIIVSLSSTNYVHTTDHIPENYFDLLNNACGLTASISPQAATFLPYLEVHNSSHQNIENAMDLEPSEDFVNKKLK